MVDYTYYCVNFGGSMTEEQFQKVKKSSLAIVNRVTFGKLKEMDSIPDEAKDAVCSVADELLRQSDGRGEITGESNHGVSRSYAVSGKSNEQKLYEAARRHLGNTGLLFRGV